jgi:hypothetical protein
VRQKPVDEYTGLDAYVHGLIAREDPSFFPLVSTVRARPARLCIPRRFPS